MLWEEVRAAAGLRYATDLTPHVIRHNFASRLVRNGADLKSVGTLLSHSSLVITDWYVHADTEQVRQAA